MFEHLPWKIESALERFFRSREQSLEFLATDAGTLLASLLTLPKVALNENPHLVVVSDLAAAESLVCSLNFIAPKVSTFILPAFDVGVYSNLYPSRRVVAGRLRWLWRAQNARPADIFIAPIEALVQRTLPYQTLAHKAFRL